MQSNILRQTSTDEDGLGQIIVLSGRFKIIYFDLNICEYIYIYTRNKATTALRKCSRCKSVIEITYVGSNRKGEPYKTCDTCRNNKKQIEVKQEICRNKTFLDYYINLLIFKF